MVKSHKYIVSRIGKNGQQHLVSTAKKKTVLSLSLPRSHLRRALLEAKKYYELNYDHIYSNIKHNGE